jgi:hypothetical protein
LILIGAAISIPVGVASPFGADWIKERLGLRSVRNARRRSRELKKELNLITGYRDDSQKLHTFLLGRLLAVVVLMVGQAFVDSSIGVLGILNYGVSLAELNGIVGVASSVIDIVVG